MPLIKAIRVRSRESLQNLDQYDCDYFLLDAFTKDYGGKGKRFDLSLLEGITMPKPFFLAGGLTAGNVAALMTSVHPYGVDVSSAVETDGIKDAKRFMLLSKQSEERMKKMSNGRYGTHGGQYVPETLMNAVLELQKAYETYKKDPQFIKELQQLYHDYANRPSLLYYAERMTQDLGGAKIYLKREDLNHTGPTRSIMLWASASLQRKWAKAHHCGNGRRSARRGNRYGRCFIGP